MKLKLDNAFFIRSFLLLSMIGFVLKLSGVSYVDNETLTQILGLVVSLIGLGNIEKFAKKEKK